MTDLIRTLVAEGSTSRQIARALGMTLRAVNKQRLRHRIFAVKGQRARRRH